MSNSTVQGLLDQLISSGTASRLLSQIIYRSLPPDIAGIIAPVVGGFTINQPLPYQLIMQKILLKIILEKNKKKYRPQIKISPNKVKLDRQLLMNQK